MDLEFLESLVDIKIINSHRCLEYLGESFADYNFEQDK
jgi:hypothetical protein